MIVPGTIPGTVRMQVRSGGSVASIIKTPSGKWKAIIRKAGWPLTVKTFRTQRDAGDWARRTEDEMVRGAFIKRASGDRMTVAVAMQRYLSEVVPTKRPTSQDADRRRSRIIIRHLGKYSLSALTPEIIATFRDMRLAGEDRKDPKGRPRPRANNTVRLDMALLGHMFTIAIKEWGISLPSNPLLNVRKPAPGPGRNRRLAADEELCLLTAVDRHSNPMLGWIVRIALETGMRFSEIVGLRRVQVDLKRRLVRLLETKNTQPRTVPLSSAATELLRQALSSPSRPIDTDMIFPGEPGRDGKRRPYRFDRMWQRIKKEQGLKDVRFHDLRHEAVSRFVEAGFSDQEVSAISGHKSMQMLKRYTHLRAEDLVARIDEASKKRR
jgi:integrase